MKVGIVYLASVLPPEHPGWQNPNICSKQFTLDGTIKASSKLKISGVPSFKDYNAMSHEDKVLTQVKLIQKERDLHDKPDSEDFISCYPKIDRMT